MFVTTWRQPVVVGFCLAVLASGCAGSESPDNPIGPSVAQSGSSLSPLSDARLLSPEALAAVDGLEAAAVNLSGTWKGAGTVKVDRETVKFLLTVRFTHSARKLKGAITHIDGDKVTGMTFDLTESSVGGTKRTFKGTLRTVEKGDTCSPATYQGSAVVDTAKKTMTGTFKGRGSDCENETATFTLKKM